MRIKRIELKDFKRFKHLIVEGLSETCKLVILVGPNGSGKTSFMEAFNHYYKYSGYANIGDSGYLLKQEEKQLIDKQQWIHLVKIMVNIDFFDMVFSKEIGEDKNIRGHFYFRSAYRNEPDFRIDSMKRQGDPTDRFRLENLMQNDLAVSQNYQRLISNTIKELYDDSNSRKTVEELKQELIGKIRDAMKHIFDDLDFSSIGQPLTDGNFYFTKGTSKNFNYINLSAGEKSAFDLILDMVIQAKYYPDAVYCIDEPETHMHTKLQGKVLRELYALIPGQSQLWISTHSIGMLQEAEQIEKDNPGTVAFLDFSDHDFDMDQKIRPTKIGKAIIEKFYELAFGDFAKMILPKTIVFCEGAGNGNGRNNFDKSIYSKIFEESHPDTLFISGGSCNDIERIEETYGDVYKSLLSSTKIIKVVDRDDRSPEEIAILRSKGIKCLGRRNLESYLLDYSVIEKLCNVERKTEKIQNCKQGIEEALANSVGRGNAPDDYKSARGEIYNCLKRQLGLTQCGNNADAFIRDTLTPLITPDMEIYAELEKDVFE